ncbi:hypothetical protein QYF61_014771 [Mycteria americana]|uniref:Uncharacterized protein n=1 Tax=Mycteria americana TaxID=33587 RepID=A0AAN7NYF0_MYCAM|nr:hypothetical protein QYF61_014771 [Mycteria americana]
MSTQLYRDLDKRIIIFNRFQPFLVQGSMPATQIPFNKLPENTKVIAEHHTCPTHGMSRLGLQAQASLEQHFHQYYLKQRLEFEFKRMNSRGWQKSSMRDSITYRINLLPCGILCSLWWSEANVGVQRRRSALTRVAFGNTELFALDIAAAAAAELAVAAAAGSPVSRAADVPAVAERSIESAASAASVAQDPSSADMTRPRHEDLRTERLDLAHLPDRKDFTASYTALTEPKDRLDALTEKRFAGPQLATYSTSVTQTTEGAAAKMAFREGPKHPRVLQELADIVARPLSITFGKSWRSGDIPED